MKEDYLFHYADKTLQVSGSRMIFFTPDVLYKFEVLNELPAGFFSVFGEPFYLDPYEANIC